MNLDDIYAKGKELGISHRIIKDRYYKYHWKVEDLLKPVQKKVSRDELREVSEKYGIPIGTLISRRFRKMPIEDVLYGGDLRVKQAVTEKARKLGVNIPKGTIYNRIHSGYPEELVYSNVNYRNEFAKMRTKYYYKGKPAVSYIGKDHNERNKFYSMLRYTTVAQAIKRWTDDNKNL